MDVLCWIASISRVRDGIGYRLTSLVILQCGVIFIVCATGVAAVASYLWLATALPDYLAALCVAGELLFVGGVFFAVAYSRRRHGHARPRATRSPDMAPDMEGQAENAVDRAIEAAFSEAKKSPSSALLTALALGLVIGLLRPNADR